MNKIIDLPWCIIGDLNELANPSEKRGGKHYPLSKLTRLTSFMDRIKASSIPFTGYPCTWKKRLQLHIIYERLDKGIIWNDWLKLYPDSIVKHGTFSCSDHSPIVLSVANPIQRRKKLPFRFQNYWCQYRQLDPIVGKQWQSRIQGTKMFILSQKLKTTKQHIKLWARSFLGNNQQKLLTTLSKNRTD